MGSHDRDRPGRGVLALLRRRVSIDTRALAALRIALGVILLVDLARRGSDLVAFYTDAGVVPRSTLVTLAPTFRAVSLHAVWGSAGPQVVLFAIAGLFAVLLVIGYETRIATLASFLLLVSLHVRNPAVLNGGDSLLRHLLFWGTLVPLGERWSVDAVRADTSRHSVAGFATAGLLAQVVLVYATNAILKLRGDIWLRGGAVEQVMELTRFSTWAGEALLEVPYLLGLADVLWLGLLVASPLLIVVTGPRRVVLPALLGAMHLGMAVLMELGLFPFISVAALLPFLPAAVWDRVPDPTGPFRWLDALVPSPAALPGLPAVRSGLHSLVGPLAALFLCAMLLVNAVSVGYVQLPERTPDAVEDKAWNMFAPRPPSDDGWYVLPARLESGRQVNALQGTALTWDRPPDVDSTYPNNRWQKFLYQVRSGEEAVLQRPLARYLCRRWNRSHEDEMVSLRIVYVEFPTDRPGRGDRITVGRFDCTSDE